MKHKLEEAQCEVERKEAEWACKERKEHKKQCKEHEKHEKQCKKREKHEKHEKCDAECKCEEAAKE